MTSFPASLAERLACFGPVKVRAMFGGHVVFYQGLMFGLVSEGRLFLKIDGSSKALFVDRGCDQFKYRKQDKWVGLSYFSAPPDMFDSSDLTLRWATVAYESALRAQGSRPTRRKVRKSAMSTFGGIRRS